MESKAEKKSIHTHTETHTRTQNNIIKRVGGMPWEPTGVCLWGRRGQVCGHTSSVSAERRVDHTNSIMATNTAMMRPQISTTKMPPMFSMPRPENGSQVTNISRHMQKHTNTGNGFNFSKFTSHGNVKTIFIMSFVTARAVCKGYVKIFRKILYLLSCHKFDEKIITIVIH